MTRCQCLMVRDRVASDGRAVLDICGSSTSGPDDPMCDDCRSHGHDTHPDQVPLGDPRRAPFAHMLRADAL